MIFNMPVSWLVTEVFSVFVFFACVVHASRQTNAAHKILELFGFILMAALFENIGVSVAKTYYYDVRRIMMIGGVPLEILFLEASIWYTAFTLVQKLNLPAWAQPFVVGLFSMLHDMTVDPAAVFDRYALSGKELIEQVNASYPGALIDGSMSGQWNWTNPGYVGGFFGIPFYNFSGWMTMMVWFTTFVLIGRWFFAKNNKPMWETAYPWLAGVLAVICIASPVNTLLLFGTPVATWSNMTMEIVMLCANITFAVVLLAVFHRRQTGIDLKKDGLIVFALPAILHCYDIAYAFIMGTTVAYVPVCVISALHLAFLAYVFYRNSVIIRAVA